MNQRKLLFKNTAIIAIGRVSTQIISFLLLPLYTSKLSPEEFGTYDFLATLCTFLLPVITLVMEESMFRFLIDAEDSKNKNKVITATCFYTIIGTVVFTLIAFVVMKIISFEYTITYLLFIISNILLGLSNSLSRGEGKIKLYSIGNFILGFVTIILNILFIVALNWGVGGLLWANTIANFGTSILILAILKLGKYFNLKDLNKKTMKEMIKYSVPLVPNNLSWLIIGLSDRLMLTWLAGADANGIYSIANKFSYILYTCYSFFSAAWKESAARIVKEDNKNEYYNGIYKDIKNFLKAVVLGFIAVMPFAFSIFVDPSYNESYKYIPILIISIYYTSMSNYYGGIFTAYKETKIIGITTFVAAAINVIINVIFIPIIGIYAAAFSTLISNFLVYLYRRYKIIDYIKLDNKFNFIYWVFLIVVLVSYYINNFVLNIIVFILVAIYSFVTNRKFLFSLAEPYLKKLKIIK